MHGGSTLEPEGTQVPTSVHGGSTLGPEGTQVPTSVHGGSTLGPEGTQVSKSWLAPKLWIVPKFSRTLDTL